MCRLFGKTIVVMIHLLQIVIFSIYFPCFLVFVVVVVFKLLLLVNEAVLCQVCLPFVNL